VNQTLEAFADNKGVENVLDTGRARRPNPQWNERGALLMLDFFVRLERAAGVSPLNPIGFLQTHPHPSLRIPLVQLAAQSWHQSHPG
jgi:predicted Zn-dependent protease